MSTEYVTDEQIKQIIEESEVVLNELSNELSHLSVRIGPTSPDIINAIKNVFGTQHIRHDGSAYITYNMYSKVIELLGQTGKYKVQEYLP